MPGHLQDSVLLAFKTTGTQWRHMNFGIKDVEVMYSLARLILTKPEGTYCQCGYRSAKQALPANRSSVGD